MLHANNMKTALSNNSYRDFKVLLKLKTEELKESVPILLEVASYTPVSMHILLLEATYHF